MTPGPVVVLAGGTGGAKLARGMLDVVGDQLVVIANTADDVEVYGAHVCPDPDLITFWLADRIDERGWGLAGDTFAAMEQLAELGAETWFRLGDRDLAIGLQRAQRLAAGATLTEALDELCGGLGVPARVLPMADQRVRTRVLARGTWSPFQRFMIVEQGAGPIDDLTLDGIDDARATRQVLDAIAAAQAIVIGPSNPVISIGPILRTPGIADALRASAAPIVAVSPIVGGRVVKGPTEPFMAWAGFDCDADGIATCYAELIDGLVADEPIAGDLPLHHTDTLMVDAAARRRVAEETLDFARGLT